MEIGVNKRVLVCRRPEEEWARMSIMIWGCITYEGMGTITIVNGNIKAAKYIDIIKNNVWRFIARHFPNNDYIYQDDNAPAHRARIVKEYIDQNQINCMEWPVQSPDLNKDK